MTTLATVTAASSNAATTASGTSASSSTTRSAAFTEALETAKKELRKGETLKPVDGHQFGRIDGGTRDDMCVNLSGNARSGEAFDLITRAGRTFHVYNADAGEKKVVVEIKDKRTAESTSTDTSASTTAASTGASAASFTAGTTAD